MKSYGYAARCAPILFWYVIIVRNTVLGPGTPRPPPKELASLINSLLAILWGPCKDSAPKLTRDRPTTWAVSRSVAPRFPSSPSKPRI